MYKRCPWQLWAKFEHAIFCVWLIFRSKRNDLCFWHRVKDKTRMIVPEFGMESLEMDAVVYYNIVISSVSEGAKLFGKTCNSMSWEFKADAVSGSPTVHAWGVLMDIDIKWLIRALYHLANSVTMKPTRLSRRQSQVLCLLVEIAAVDPVVGSVFPNPGLSQWCE